jgi:hypothetical protein
MNYQGPDAACVKGDFANIIKFFTEGEAHIHIKEIDGVPTSGNGLGPYCFAPGTHKLGVSATNSNQLAQDYVNLEFGSAREYWLRGNFRGIRVDYQLFDVTIPPEVKVAEFSMTVGSAQPNAAPVYYVPVKR